VSRVVLLGESTGLVSVIDADKEWYRNYLDALVSKMKAGGSITAHNVLNSRLPGIREYLRRLENLPGVETTILRESGSGIAVSRFPGK